MENSNIYNRGHVQRAGSLYLAEPRVRLLIVREGYLQYRCDSVRLLKCYNEKTESESVEDPDNEETTSSTNA